VGHFAPRLNPVRFACVQFWICSLLSLLAAFILEEPAWAGIKDAAVPILYGGLGSVGIAYTLQVVAQRDAPAAHAAIILSLEGAFAALTGWLILGETLDTRGLIGCGLMLTGMLASELGGLFGSSKEPAPEPSVAAESVTAERADRTT
jgi:drug/metabolite transporter (DMT)-like permease